MSTERRSITSGRAALRALLVLSLTLGGMGLSGVPLAYAESTEVLKEDFEDFQAGESVSKGGWERSRKGAKEGLGLPKVAKPGLNGTERGVKVSLGQGMGRDFSTLSSQFTVEMYVEPLSTGRSITIALRGKDGQAGPYISFGKRPGYISVHKQKPGRSDDLGGRGIYKSLPFEVKKENHLKLVVDPEDRTFKIYLNGETDGKEWSFNIDNKVASLSQLDIDGVYGAGSAWIDEIRVYTGEQAPQPVEDDEEESDQPTGDLNFTDGFENYTTGSDVSSGRWGYSFKKKYAPNLPTVEEVGLNGTNKAVKVDQGEGMLIDFGLADEIFTVDLYVKPLGSNRSVTIAVRDPQFRAGAYISFGKVPGYVSLHRQKPGKTGLSRRGIYPSLPFKEDEENHLQLVINPSARTFKIYLNGQTDDKEWSFMSKIATALSKLDVAGLYGSKSAYVDEIKIYRGDASANDQ